MKFTGDWNIEVTASGDIWLILKSTNKKLGRLSESPIFFMSPTMNFPECNYGSDFSSVDKTGPQKN